MRVKPLGIYHNLEIIFAQMNGLYFEEQIRAQIIWGRQIRARSRAFRSIRLGSYCPQKKLITIHPALDQACVPRVCVERVVFHEMLHQKHEQNLRKTKRIHTRAFLDEERRFTHLETADTWFKHNLNRVLNVKKI